MKKTRIIITVLFAFACATSAYAQIGRGSLGGGAGLGSRLGARAQQRTATEANLQADLQAQQAAQAQATQAQAAQAQAAQRQSAATTATRGTTRPIANPSATAATGAATQTPAASSAKKLDGSELVVPQNATSKELLAKASELLATEASFDTEAEYNAWVAKMLQTVGAIADKVLAMNPTDDAEFIEAITVKGQVLCYQASINPQALARLKAYADALSKNARAQSLPDGKDAALAFMGVYHQAKVAEIAENNGTEKDLVAAMAAVAAFIKANPEASDMTVDLVYPVAIVAENVKNPKLPAQIWTPIRKILADSDSPRAKSALVMLEGAIRYSELEGKTFVWKGCDPDGKPLDQTLVEGRVNLVVFWASWCEPCVLLHKQLAALYETYHKDGFEIVAYNLDGEMKDMNDYLAKNPTPGIILSDRATVDAKQTSLAAYYGVTEIPTMILVGGDGKVAAVDISIESLAATLQSVFKKPAPDLPGLAAEAQPNRTATGAAASTGASTGSVTPRATTGTATGTATGTGATTTRPATGSTTVRRSNSTTGAARRSN